MKPEPSLKLYKLSDPMNSRNVIDAYKSLSNEEIKEQLKHNSLPFAVLCFNLIGDFNMSCVIRSANALGAREVFYFGEKRFDRRGAVGCQNYIDINHLKSWKELLDLTKKYSLIGLEQTDRSVDISQFKWDTKLPPCIVIGEEGCGLMKEVLELCDNSVEIKQRGSVRSMNVASAFSICAYDFASKYNRRIE